MQFVHELKKQKNTIILISIATVSHSIFALGMARFSKYVFDGVENRNISFMHVLLIGLAVVLWGAISVLCKSYFTECLISKLSYSLRSNYVTSVIECSLPKLNELGDGRVLTNYTQDIGAVSNYVRSGMALIVIPFEMVISLLYLYVFNWKLATIVMLVFPVIMITGRTLGKQIQKISSNYLVQNDSAMNLLTRILKGIEVIKAHNYNSFLTDEFHTYIAEQRRLDINRAKYNGLFAGITDFFMGLPFVIVFFSAALLTNAGTFSVGTLTLFLQLLNKITVPFLTYSNVMMQFKGAKVSMERLNEVIAAEKEEQKPIRGFGDIEFNNVTFGYDEGSELLSHCSALFRKGIYYGVIGANGSGKSTITKLIASLYHPTEGIIDYHFELDKSNKIVYIEDTPAIMFDDIIKNITMNCAMDSKKLDKILEETELKTATVDNITGKGAGELSAGLLQRMVLARALYQLQDGDMLIIDEGFSALDVDVRPRMYQLVKDYQTKLHLTVFDITHNVNERERFDEIIMLNNRTVQKA